MSDLMDSTGYVADKNDENSVSSGSFGTGLIAVVPAVLFIAIFLLLPALYTLYLGFSDLGGFRTLWLDKLFTQSLLTSFYYSIVTVFVQTVFGTLTAATVHRTRFGASAIGWLLFLPYAIPSVVAVVAWKFLILDHGVISRTLNYVFAIDTAVWMGDEIFWTLVVISVWQFYPFVFLSLLARMRRIPPALYKSAHLDGASSVRQFLHVTLPFVRSTLVAVVILRFAFMFTKFDTPWLLVGGTANDRVDTLPIYIYRNLWIKPGISAAIVMAAVLFLMISSFFLARRILKTEDL